MCFPDTAKDDKFPDLVPFSQLQVTPNSSPPQEEEDTEEAVYPEDQIFDLTVPGAQVSNSLVQLSSCSNPQGSNTLLSPFS